MSTSALTKTKKTDGELIICIFGQGVEDPAYKKTFCAEWKKTEMKKGRLQNGENPCGNCPFRFHNFN